MTPALSPSRAADFKQCPLLFRFRTIDKLEGPPSPAAARGTLVHAVLEHLFDLPAADRTPAAAVALLAPRWSALVEERPELKTMIDDDELLTQEGWFAAAQTLVEQFGWDTADAARVSVEAASPLGWHRWVGDRGAVVAMQGFGASAPAGALYKHFGFTGENVAARARAVLEGVRV